MRRSIRSAAVLAVVLTLPGSLAGQYPDTISLERLREARVRSSGYATPGLRDFVAAAAEANRVLPELLESYRSGVESELSLLQSTPDGDDVVLQVEQVASRLDWRRGQPLVQTVAGYRSKTLGLVPSLLGMFEVPWIVPTLYGESIDLVRWSAPATDAEGRVRRRRAIHPLGADRDRVYTFSGGDTVLVLRLPDRTIPLVRVRVTPTGTPERATLLFEGTLDIDATRHQIVRMRGRMIATDPDPTLDARILGAAFSGATFVEFESAEYDGRFWLPRYQRIEVQAISRLTESRVAMRVVSRFVAPDPNPDPPVEARGDLPPGGLLEVGDLLAERDFEGWTSEMGTLTGDAALTDFADLESDRRAPDDGVRVRFGVRHLSQLVHYNPAEGLFTGGGGIVEAGGLGARTRGRVHAGWAWKEQTVRGGASVTYIAPDGWEMGAYGERQIVETGDFVGVWGGEPGVAPLFAGDEQAFHDRRIGGLVARRPGVARFELGRGSDRVAGEPPTVPDSAGAAQDPPPVGRFAVDEGSYWIARATLGRSQRAPAFGLGTGAAYRLHGEAARGDLDWVRLEAGATLGRTLGSFSVDGRLDGGLLLSDAPPPQALFELGRYSGLAGYPARAFSGDRAVVGQGAVSYTLPLLRRPLGGQGFFLPAVSPAPTVILRAGWTDASEDTRAVLDRIGAVTSDGVRATLDLRMRFFGGGVSVGFARPLDEGGSWRFVWSLVAEF